MSVLVVEKRINELAPKKVFIIILNPWIINALPKGNVMNVNDGTNNSFNKTLSKIKFEILKWYNLFVSYNL